MSCFCWWFFLNFCLKSHICPFFVQKQQLHDVPFIKTITFCENCRFFSDDFFWHSVWNLTFFLFFCQKTSKKTQYTLQKNRYVLWKLSVFCRRFFWNSVWNLTFCLFFCKKTTKKAWYAFQKNRYVLGNLSFYYKGFSLQICLKSHLLPFFWFKKNYKKTYTLQITRFSTVARTLRIALLLCLLGVRARPFFLGFFFLLLAWCSSSRCSY